MFIKIDGVIELPDGMSEDLFNTLFLQFIERHGMSFGGGTQLVEED